ncbi:hypothetical protein EA458_03855 [Streptococcus dysgalactiae subsp. dysgalactiae]|nr:hypothetical protein EA458_03855 [Streptococcus dysgalactiae subsp. dysgalactiae]
MGLTKGEVLERLVVARGDASGLFLWMLSGGDSLKLLEKRVREEGGHKENAKYFLAIVHSLMLFRELKIPHLI